MRWVRFTFLLVWCTMLLLPLHAQQPLQQRGRLWVQYNPLTLLEPELPAALALLYPVGNRWSVGVEAAVYLLRRNMDNWNKNEAISGFRLRPQIRIYPGNQPAGKIERWYLSAELLLKQTRQARTDWVAVLDNAGLLLFEQWATYTEVKWVNGLTVGGGVEVYLFKTNPRWMVDIYGGAGLRVKQFSRRGLPPGADATQSVRNGRVFSLNTNGWFPTLTLGLRVSYQL